MGQGVTFLPDGRDWSHAAWTRPFAWLWRDRLYHAFKPEEQPATSLCGAVVSETMETKTPGAPACQRCFDAARLEVQP